MPDEGQGVRSTDRETQTISRRRRRRKQSWGLVVEGFLVLGQVLGQGDRPVKASTRKVTSARWHADPSRGGELRHKANPCFLALTAIGIVFGDIGTSPLYTLS